MFLKSAVSVSFFIGTVGLAWAISGFMDAPPCSKGRGCPAAPDAGTYMMMLFISAIILTPGFVLVVRWLDWRPLMGLPVGGVIGVAVTLSGGRSLGHWVAAAAVLAGAGGIATGLSIAIRSIATPPQPTA
ncbi:hypothetical protein [Streptomyces sp. NPDC055099]